MNKLMTPLLFLGAAFLVFAIWRNPATAAADVGNLAGSIGSWLQDAISRIAEFFSNLGS